ncbi:hypothetical protein, partial [Klebsiella oxytoca]|uniref:hypothetical protein n=1 Tax=Klebsiella oxytoca TaxID=571 RepID=UPI00195321BF
VLWLGIVAQIVAGVLLMVGFWTAPAAALLLFLLAATPMSTISGTIRARTVPPRSTVLSAISRWQVASLRCSPSRNKVD